MSGQRPLPDLELAQSKASLSPRALSVRYLTALGLVALLTLSGQALFQTTLRDDQGYSRTIDLAGRQRMLAMALTRAAVGLQAGSDQSLRAQALDELAANLEAWQAMNRALLQGKSADGLKPGGPEIRQAWQELHPLIGQIAEGAGGLLRAARAEAGAPGPETRRLGGELRGLGERYLPAMDALVALYAEEARQRARSLQTLGLTLAGLVLALLLFEGLFIFRPIARRIRSDMFNLTALAQEMRELSLKDGLTGVYNRRHLDEQLAQEWRRAAREDHDLALLLLDIDHFKAYNDLYGHQAGDLALKSVAGAVHGELRRAGDLLARYGGEEFAVVLPQTGLGGAMLLAENIRVAVKALAIPNAGSSAGPLLTVSLGAAVARPARQESPEGLVEAADLALYRAKQSGRDRVAGPPGALAEEWS
jgi:diguanylate cyclase (GGDEF)-like protein